MSKTSNNILGNISDASRSSRPPRSSPVSLSSAFGVAATTITRLARTDDKAASVLSLDLAGKVVSVLDCGIEDLLGGG